MNNAANQQIAGQDPAALAQELHDVKISSMMKALQSQRESAQNALVNLLSEKAVVDHRLAMEQERGQQLAAALGQKNQENAELRILILNLQAQIRDLQNPPEAAKPEEGEAAAAAEAKAQPAADERIAESESPSLLKRAGQVVAKALG